MPKDYNRFETLTEYSKYYDERLVKFTKENEGLLDEKNFIQHELNNVSIFKDKKGTKNLSFLPKGNILINIEEFLKNKLDDLNKSTEVKSIETTENLDSIINDIEDITIGTKSSLSASQVALLGNYLKKMKIFIDLNDTKMAKPLYTLTGHTITSIRTKLSESAIEDIKDQQDEGKTPYGNLKHLKGTAELLLKLIKEDLEKREKTSS